MTGALPPRTKRLRYDHDRAYSGRESRKKSPWNRGPMCAGTKAEASWQRLQRTKEPRD